MTDLDAQRLIAFVANENDFYVVNKTSGEITAISNPTKNEDYNCIRRVENIMIIRDVSSLLFFDCNSLTITHHIEVALCEFYGYQNLMHIEVQGNELVILTPNGFETLLEVRMKLYQEKH